MSGLDDHFTEYDHITSTYVANALNSFPLKLITGRDHEWLAKCIQRTLHLAAILNDSTNPITKTELPDLRNDFLKLAEATSETWQELFELLPRSNKISDLHRMEKSRKREFFLREFAFVSSAVDPSPEYGEPIAYSRFRHLVSELEWAAHFLRCAAQAAPVKRGRSASSEPVLRVQFLAAVFEAAFGIKPTANQFPSNPLHKRPTNFMLFCQLFGDFSHFNFKDIVSKGLAEHRRAPLSFADGLL
jgi:hypothetical protein